MNQGDILRIARDSGMELYGLGRGRTNFVFILERFAALIEQHLSYDSIHTCHAECQRPACVAVREAVKAEREACAQLCESYENDLGYGQPQQCANAIRARGES